LKSKHGLEFSPGELLDALGQPVGQAPVHDTPHVWPSGPKPGVYVTTSQDAIDNLLRRYEEATDGELVYAEEAGSHWDGSIELGKYGLSSKGLSRVPSGTLIIVGPLALTQESWKESADKLDWACIRAECDEHRVAVLIDTPTPDLMFKDIEMMVRSAAPEDDDGYTALAGVITDDGELKPRVPFVQESSAPVVEIMDAPLDVIPESVLPHLRQALERRPTGILTFGSSVLEEHRAIDLIAAMLPLTNGVGPVCRIKQQNRSTPAKDMMVPDAIKPLPFMPSIESAYAHGYRRMIVGAYFTRVDAMVKCSGEVLFLTGHYTLDATSAFMETGYGSRDGELELLLENLVAAVGVGVIKTRDEVVRIGDLFVPPTTSRPGSGRYGDITDFVAANRVVRWEDQLGQLLDTKQVSIAAAKKAFERLRGVEDFFAERSRSKKIGANT
jgi:hypothetical protein